MSLLGPNLITYTQLISRNEGKLKSYESCTDVRAWSHDKLTQSNHLRAWIKRDMPICVLPISTLANFLRAMTCRSRARTTPRCHPGCKSKVLIDSLCTSCHAIKECLNCNPKFDKYFAEEEFDTSHWPCDRCLEVLKSIKMLWKILVEKVFGINLSKTEELETTQSESTDNVKSVAKLWEREIVQQALYVKNITSVFNQNMNQSSSSCWAQDVNKKDTITHIPRPIKTMSKEASLSKVNSPTRSFVSQRSRMSDIGRSSYTFSKNYNRLSRRIHKCTSVRVATRDVACSCDLGKNKDETNQILSYKLNVACLQEKCNMKEIEIERLQRENDKLKFKLQNFCKISYNLPKSHIAADVLSNCDITALVPKPFESNIKSGSKENISTNADSEMIITMKNGRHESFKHVSLLQILHKTNQPLFRDESINTPGFKKQNPIELLTKVRNTFGEIVKREIKIVDSKKHDTHHDIEATFFKLNNSQSAPSCSTVCSDTTSSEFNFASA